MGRIKKDYHELEELTARWKLSESDLRYAVENGLLTLSVRIYGANMELGSYEDEDWGRMPVPYEHTYFDGVVDIRRYDIYRLFQEGEVAPNDFSLPNGDYANLLNPHDVRPIRRANLVVREEERARFEHDVLESFSVAEPSPPDFRRFTYDDHIWRFTEMQARAMLYLYNAARNGDPEQHCRKILEAAGSQSEKIGHLFSTRKGWKQLVHPSSGRSGWYFLEPRLVVAMAA